MLINDLVSLIAPFYNGKPYLERFLKSVLNQTYSNVQFILVNDGSTDDSDELVEKHRTDLEQKFKEFIYLKQDNRGAASAVNLALKYVKGEYLCWADCDDELLPENIEKKYLFLMQNSRFGLVNCGARAIDQTTGIMVGDLVIPLENRHDNMFRQILNGIPVYPGVFMIRTQLLFDKLSNREIYFNREAGQNYQLLLPVAYDNKCGFIDDILYNYYIRSDSHSHNVDYKKAFQRTYVGEELLGNVLKFLPRNEYALIMEDIHNQKVRKRFELSFATNDFCNAKLAFSEIQNIATRKERIKYIIICNKMLNHMYRWLKR